MSKFKLKLFQQELKLLLDKYNITFVLDGYDCEAYINIVEKGTHKLIKENLYINSDNIIEQ